VRGWSLLLVGDVARAHGVMLEVERLAGSLGSATASLQLAFSWRLPTGDFERVLRESAHLVERARVAGALGMLATPLSAMADAAHRLGDWATAEAASQEAQQIAAETGQHLIRGLALTCSARVAAARGAEFVSREAGEAALGLADSRGIESNSLFACAALGFLELSLERVPEAIGRLERATGIAERCGLAAHGQVPWAADLIEAYVRSGRTGAARHALAPLGRQVLSAEIAWPRAMHARCVGMVTDDYDASFVDALAWDDRRPMPFERARTQLAYGRRLHRECRRAEARVQLHAALDGFERLGATPWAIQARNELRATGGRRPRSDCDPSTLSPQESRVATVAARGGSTRDVATELFLAPKTVEFHLGQIYRKLGVRNRGQMIVALADGPRPHTNDG
jgi:ATP/maltotriose-dependent transcriptional regulator MalT